jgi:DMSO/TMAO reductase YedYZ molybdopterin-dependent catalytic subunit
MESPDDDPVSTTASSRTAVRPSSADRFGGDTLAAISGVAATAAALGTAELLAGILPSATSLIASVGQVVVDLQPPGAKDFVVSLFGTNDKLALEVVIVIVSLVVGAGLGVLARRSFVLASLGFAAFGVIGFVAALGDPVALAEITAIVAALSVAVGLLALNWLLSRSGALATEHAAAGETASRPQMPDWSRRAFMVRAGAVGVVAVGAGLFGRMLLEGQRTSPVGVGPQVPPASDTVPPLTPEEDLSPTIPALTPIVMPNDRFYKIDTALLVPNVDTANWTLRVFGMVDRETTLTWDQLIALPMFEQYVTIACVSNEVGDKLVGNAKWTGVRLRDVLDMAGVQVGATQLVGRSVDGFTAGMPTAWVMDTSREPMIALKMNDQPLPRNHGYPARLIVPGLYGYVSATKWLKELELTTLEAFDGYWVPLGWAKEAPILTQSRIDTPRGDVAAGTTVPIAGVAWAPDRGISKVEVSIDGVWQDAKLSTPISSATWVQWVLPWTTTSGRHVIQVRATDGTGAVQEETPSPPAPDGARGWHTVTIDVG